MNTNRLLCLALLLAAMHAPGATHYVKTNSPNPAPPYLTWNMAARTIQDAIDVSAAGDTVVVTNGLYATGGRALAGDPLLTNRVFVDRAITVRSVNGPLVTTIKGYQVPGTNNGNGAIRCVYLTNGAVLSGFTLTNGATRFTAPGVGYRVGGGILAWSNALATNCILVGNTAQGAGGGASGGTLIDCQLIRNSTEQGGGVANATLFRCTLTSNMASGAWGPGGGGAIFSTLSNGTLIGNQTGYYGGGTDYCDLTNCTLTGNTAAYYGGAANLGRLYNCTLVSNNAGFGGGTRDSALIYCKLVGNLATDSANSYGGGAERGTLYNCLIVSNRGSGTGGAGGAESIMPR